MTRGAGRPTHEAIRDRIVAGLCDAVGASPGQIDPHEPFAAYGLGSRDAVTLAGELEEWLGTRLAPTVFYEHPTVASLAEHLAGLDPAVGAAPPGVRSATPEPIALIGIGCRFPGARDAESFRRLLNTGQDAVTPLPPEREALIGAETLASLPAHGRWGGFLEDVDAFDAPFFGIGAAEASSMDPQQRLLLEVAWEALEHAGQDASGLAGSRTGVFVGISTSDYALLRLREQRPGDLDAYFGTSNSPSVAAGRLAYQFGFHGPALSVDTACSSSLVAVHLACQSLRAAECDLALAAGVNLMLAPETTLWACRARILSETGRCRTFDRAADGYVRGEGCGVVVLKRLADARAARDRVLAVVGGSAVNHDGRSSGLTAPNGIAQQRVILQALAQATLGPEDIRYVEAHGTGTALGDPIEIRALGRALCSRRPASDPLVVGSVKTNVGHLEAAAGIAGLIKTTLALGQDRIPPHLHLTEISPYIAREELAIAVAGEACSWPAGVPRVAGVSSFGLSGTNAHVVLEGWSGGAAEDGLEGGGGAVHVLPISARSATALRALAKDFRSALDGGLGSLARICATAATRRAHHRHRLAVWGTTAAELAGALEDWVAGRPCARLAEGTAGFESRSFDVPVPLTSEAAGMLAAEYCAGADIRWSHLFPLPLPPVVLPTYPFDRHRYWLERPETPVRARLAAAQPAGRDAVLLAYIAAAVARCLDVPASALDPAEPLSGLGLDSLMAIDVSNRLAVDLDVRVDPVDLVDRLSIAGLTAIVSERMAPADDASALSPSVAADALPPAAAAATAFPLSHAQQRIWILDQLTGASAAYVIPSAVSIRGPLDASALERALRAAVARHDALRTSITVVDGQPLQTVHPAVDCALPVIDLQHLPGDRRQAEAEARAAAEAARPLDLASAPLFRTMLFRLGPEEHLWVVGIHHIVADGTSLAILLHDVLESYRAGGAALPPSTGASFSQFVAWQERRLESGALQQAEEAMLRRLDGFTPLQIPTDRPRTADRSFAGRSIPVQLPAALSSALRQLARERNVTLNGVLTAAWAILLARCAQQTDILVGTPVANRTRPEFEQVVGCFANTGVIRADVRMDRSFGEILEVVQAAIRGAWSAQELPFERLVEAAGVREPGRNPFFDAFFALNVPTPAARAGGATFEPVFLTTLAAKFDLALFCEDRADGLAGFLEYRLDLFEEATAARLMRRFAALLQAITASPDAPVGDLEILDVRDREVLALQAPPAREFSRGACVHELIRAQCDARPEARAVADDREVLTYRQLGERVGRAAQALRERGVGPGRLVAVSLPRTVDLVVTLIAILEAGAAYLPLDPELPTDRRAAIVADAGAVLLEEWPARGQGPGAAAHGGGADGSAGRALPEQLTPTDLAYVIYTSGSTGAPKGVEITHRNLVNLLESMAREPGLSAEDVLLAVTPVTFDIAALELFLPLVAGGQVVIASRKTASDGARLAAAIDSSGATAMQATPATWRMLGEAGYRPDRRLKVLCGGEALPPALAEQLTAGGAEVWNMYGPTETTIWSTTERLTPGAPPTLGLPVANTRVYVLDTRLRPVPPGSPGEICIGGEGVARGYRGRDDLTAARFIADAHGPAGSRLYRTGDIGCIGLDGRLRFVGRSDDQVKIRGFRVEPAEIEAALARCPGVLQAAVVVDRRADDDVRLSAFVKAAAGLFSVDECRARLAAYLPAYMVPSSITPIDGLPLTANGKVDRRQLVIAARAVTPTAGEADAPMTPLERDVARIWADVLGCEQVGPGDSFFDLGGHSLLAARVSARLEAQLGVRIPLNLFYAQPSVREHARYLDALRAPASDAADAERFERLLAMVEGLTDEEAEAYLETLEADGPRGGHS